MTEGGDIKGFKRNETNRIAGRESDVLKKRHKHLPFTICNVSLTSILREAKKQESLIHGVGGSISLKKLFLGSSRRSVSWREFKSISI